MTSVGNAETGGKGVIGQAEGSVGGKAQVRPVTTVIAPNVQVNPSPSSVHPQPGQLIDKPCLSANQWDTNEKLIGGMDRLATGRNIRGVSTREWNNMSGMLW